MGKISVAFLSYIIKKKLVKFGELQYDGQTKVICTLLSVRLFWLSCLFFSWDSFLYSLIGVYKNKNVHIMVWTENAAKYWLKIGLNLGEKMMW